MRFLLKLPKEQRERFHTHIGKVIRDSEITRERILSYLNKDAILVVVGDVTSATLLKNNILADIFIIDKTTKRGRYDTFFVQLKKMMLEKKERKLLVEEISVVNPKERISSELWDAIRECYKRILNERFKREEILGLDVSSNKKIYKNFQEKGAQHIKRVYLISVKGEEDLSIIPAIIEAPTSFSSDAQLYEKDIKTIIVYGIPDIGIDIFETTEEVKKTALDIVKNMEVEHGTADIF